MKRALALTLAALLALGSAPFLEDARAEKNPDWSSIKKEFKDLFKTKNALSKRRKGVSKVAKSKDPRGVAELLKALKKQEKHALKMREEYETQEAEWAEKTERLERSVEKRRQKAMEKAKEKGTDPEPISIGGEELEWLGANNQPGKMQAEKARLQKLYRSVLGEEDFSIYILRGIAKILNALDGEEYTKAAKPVAKAAEKAPSRYKSAYTRMLGYIKGDPITDALQKLAGDSKIEIQMLALESLGRQNSERGKEILYGYLSAEAWQVRAAAIQGLAFYRNAEVVDRLLAQARNEEGHLRRRCFGAMSVIVGEKVKGTIESWESWWKSNRAEWEERWAREPQSGLPVQDDPPVIAVDSEVSGGGTSFYGIQTDSKHIIFVVDVSGSMRRMDDQHEEEPAKIDVARRELKNAIKTL